MEEELDVRRSFIEAQLEEVGRMLPGFVVLINGQEVRDVQLFLERVLYETWDEAQRPLLEAFKKVV